MRQDNFPKHLVIASRESRLAMWQAEHVRQRLLALYPDMQVDILGLSTRGDQILDQSLSKIGGKGLFIKELECALQDGRADLAVHSLKDVPMQMPEGFSLAAILARETPFDALVANEYNSLADLPEGAVLGTSSLRREAMLRAHYPHFVVKSLRGNLDTRLRKLDEGQFDAIILAAAGLIRLNLAVRIRMLLPAELFLPAPGQGALGIEILTVRRDVAAWLAPLNDAETSACVRAERAFSAVLGGSCQVPLGAYATLEQGALCLRAFVARPDGARKVQGEQRGLAQDAELLGAKLAKNLLQQGARAILDALDKP